MNHPNRGWRKTWTVDLASQKAMHRDGFGVVFNRVGAEWKVRELINDHLVKDDDVRGRLIYEAKKRLAEVEEAQAGRSQ